MAKNVNKVILIGNVGQDPDFKVLPSGATIATLSLATNERFKDHHGELQERTEWHQLVAYERKAGIIREYVSQGSMLYVEGKLRTRSWDDKATGQKRYRTEIVILDLVLLSPANGNGGRSHAGQADPGPDDEYAGAAITSDDIPF